MDLFELLENPAPISFLDCSFEPSVKVPVKENGLEELISITNTSDSEDYLKKSEKLTTLAKEWFQKEHKKLSLSTTQEKLFRVNFQEKDKRNFSTLLHTLSVKVVRPCLRSMEHADDGYAKAIMALIAPCFHIQMEVIERCRYFGRTNGPFLHLTVSEDGIEGTKNIYGLKNATHTSSKRNVLYKNEDLVADIGELLALFIVISVVKNSMNNPEERAYLEHRTALSESGFPYEAYETDFYSGSDWQNADLMYLRDEKRNKELNPSFLKYLEEHFTLVHADVSTYQWKEHCKKQIESGCYGYEHRPPLFMDESKAYTFYAQNFFHMYDAIGIKWRDLQAYSNGRYWALPSLGQPQLTKLLVRLFFFWLEKRAGEVKMLQEYEQLDTEYARSFEQKKNIPVKTLAAMKSSKLNKHFGFVEFDEMVDLSKIQELTEEFRAFKNTYFPNFHGDEQCAIRFRRLYNHKAIGLYYPGVKCLCVDVRNPQSFVHEYGHLLDFGEGDLSLSAEFATVRCLYESYMDHVCTENEVAAAQLSGKGKYNRSYYCMPTEIFARSMEIYFSKIMGVSNSMLPSVEEMEHNFAYPVSDNNYLKAVEDYFNKLLSNYALKRAG